MCTARPRLKDLDKSRPDITLRRGQVAPVSEWPRLPGDEVPRQLSLDGAGQGSYGPRCSRPKPCFRSPCLHLPWGLHPLAGEPPASLCPGFASSLAGLERVCRDPAVCNDWPCSPLLGASYFLNFLCIKKEKTVTFIQVTPAPSTQMGS